MEDTSLTIGVEGDELVIRIGLSTLEFAAYQTELFTPWNDKQNDWVPVFKVTDREQFGYGVGIALQDEAEDGSTPLTRLLDECFLYAVEGDYGVDEANINWGKARAGATEKIKAGETVCEHMQRPFDCEICFPRKRLKHNHLGGEHVSGCPACYEKDVIQIPNAHPKPTCGDCGAVESDHQREYDLDCKCGGRFKT